MFGSTPKEPQINLPKKFDGTHSKYGAFVTKYVSSSNFINTIIQMTRPKLDSLALYYQAPLEHGLHLFWNVDLLF
jgi:hypothetical protein